MLYLEDQKGDLHWDIIFLHNLLENTGHLHLETEGTQIVSIFYDATWTLCEECYRFFFFRNQKGNC